MTAPPRPSAASAPTVHHELVEEASHEAGTRMAGSMQQALANLEQATDKDGNPILDQVDDEGVSMRERLQQSNEQIASLRNDPRLANSPLAGFLDAFLSPDDDRPQQ
jgi:hypothetical protein